MENNKEVKVSICGRNFFFTSGDDAEYILRIANKAGAKIGELMRDNLGMSFDQAAVLAAIKYCDDYERIYEDTKKQNKEDEDLGKRLVSYSKELTRATTRIKELEKELARLKKEKGEL